MNYYLSSLQDKDALGDQIGTLYVEWLPNFSIQNNSLDDSECIQLAPIQGWEEAARDAEG